MQQSRIFDLFAVAKRSNRETRFRGDETNERGKEHG